MIARVFSSCGEPPDRYPCAGAKRSAAGPSAAARQSWLQRGWLRHRSDIRDRRHATPKVVCERASQTDWCRRSILNRRAHWRRSPSVRMQQHGPSCYGGLHKLRDRLALRRVRRYARLEIVSSCSRSEPCKFLETSEKGAPGTRQVDISSVSSTGSVDKCAIKAAIWRTARCASFYLLEPLIVAVNARAAP